MERRSFGALILAAAAVTASGASAAAGDKSSSAKPVLKLRATPGVALPPVQVLLTAELVGGTDHEDFRCPDVEWDFSDGSRSTLQADCQPESADPVERRFTRRHAYRAAGDYAVVVTLRRTGRIVAQARATVIVHGDVSGGDSGPYPASLQ